MTLIGVLFLLVFQNPVTMSNVVKFSVLSTAVLMGLWSTRIDLSDLYLMMTERSVVRVSVSKFSVLLQSSRGDPEP